MTRNSFLIHFFFITVLHRILLLCVLQTSFSFAFVTQLVSEVSSIHDAASSTTTTLLSRSSSSVTKLFLAKKKKKTTTNANKKSLPTTRSKPSGGGTGFGNADNTNKSSSGATTTASSSRTTSKQRPLPLLDEPNDEEVSPLLRRSMTSPPPPAASTTKAATATARRKKWSERIELSEETDLLMATYMEEFRQQELREKEEGTTTTLTRPRTLVRVSKNPLIFTMDDFLDPVACSRVDSKGSGCFELYYPENVSDRLFNKQESEMDSLLFRHSTSTEHNEKPNAGLYYPDGVHMDTTNSCMFRHVTAILYLNDIPNTECGGGTVFPLARALPNDPALLASRRLLSEKISHTRSKAAVGDLAADANLLESRIGTNFAKDPHTETAIRIQPKAGRLLIFFSRDCNGKEDPRAWHAGERIKDNPVDNSVTEKRILNLFKQVDYNNDGLTNGRAQPSRAQTTFEEYLAPQIQEQQQWLQAIAQLSCS